VESFPEKTSVRVRRWIERRAERDASRASGEDGVAGVDEAGARSARGPVVVAAVILDRASRSSASPNSKVICENRARSTRGRTGECALAFSVVAVEVNEIDRYNSFWATMLGMQRAARRPAACTVVRARRRQPIAKIDAMSGPRGRRPATRANPRISAASIIAKTCATDHVRARRVHPGYDSRVKRLFDA